MTATLLLADDSVTIQRVIELTFADEDVRVVAVSDGDAAIAHIEAQPPDIVLADVDMPGKTGYDVSRYIKQSPRLAHIPVVLLTGAFEPVDEARAREVGCDGVLAKPFDPQILIGRVRELLAGVSGGAPSTEAPPSTERPRRPPLPALADAFAALLAAEERGEEVVLPDDANDVPPGDSDDLVERVARRVLERLSDRVVRETVAGLVSTVAERLIREEIERIKAEIK